MKNELIEKNDLVELIKTKKEFLRLIYEFNRIPASYVHSSWIEPIIPYNLFIRISKSGRGLVKISKMILQQNNLNQAFYYDFYESKYRLALLPGEILRTLTFYGGIALNHREIRTVIEQKRKKIIVDHIGEQGYRFAVASAPLLIGNLETQFKLRIQWDNLSGFIQECGAKLFLTAFANGPEHVYKRVLLKFQKDIIHNSILPDYDIDPLKIRSFFIRVMKQVVDRRWQQLVF